MLIEAQWLRTWLCSHYKGTTSCMYTSQHQWFFKRKMWKRLSDTKNTTFGLFLPQQESVSSACGPLHGNKFYASLQETEIFLKSTQKNLLLFQLLTHYFHQSPTSFSCGVWIRKATVSVILLCRFVFFMNNLWDRKEEWLITNEYTNTGHDIIKINTKYWEHLSWVLTKMCVILHFYMSTY